MKLNTNQQLLIARGLREIAADRAFCGDGVESDEFSNIADLIATADAVEITHHEDGGAVGGGPVMLTSPWADPEQAAAVATARREELLQEMAAHSLKDAKQHHPDHRVMTFVAQGLGERFQSFERLAGIGLVDRLILEDHRQGTAEGDASRFDRLAEFIRDEFPDLRIVFLVHADLPVVEAGSVGEAGSC